MHRLVACLVGSLSVLLIVEYPGTAAIIQQNFEVTVTDTQSAGAQPDPILGNAPVPQIGTTGLGSFTYDESQLNFINQPSSYPVGYYLGKPGKIAFSNFPLNFFDRTYTQVTSTASRIGQFLIYDRLPTGKYVPRSIFLETSDGSSVARLLQDLFIYRPGAVNLPGDITAVPYASGTFRFTEAEPVPEPPPGAIASVFALGLGWLCQRRRALAKGDAVKQLRC